MRPQRWQPTRLPRPWDSPGKNTGVGCHFPLQCVKVKSESEVAQSCPTPSDLEPEQKSYPRGRGWIGNILGTKAKVLADCLDMLGREDKHWDVRCWLWALTECGGRGCIYSMKTVVRRKAFLGWWLCADSGRSRLRCLEAFKQRSQICNSYLCIFGTRWMNLRVNVI